MSSAVIVPVRSSRLRISEIFYSLQGEADAVGWPTVFIRLTGCPLRCLWCDTTYAFEGGNWMDFETVLEQVATYRTRYVCVTGGEPLAQKRCINLLGSLCDSGYCVSLETSGALDISEVDARVRKVMDLKAPGSGEMARNHLQNLDFLQSHDQIKFVLTDRNDYEWACGMLREYQLEQRCDVLFSPVHGSLSGRQLADWILADRLPVRFQLPLHKLLWGQQPGH